jgi:phosphoglycerate-specific signal transduction histidine kinase
MKRILIILLALVITTNVDALRVYSNQIKNITKIDKNIYEVTVKLTNVEVKCYIDEDMKKLILKNRVALQLLKDKDRFYLISNLKDIPR